MWNPKRWRRERILRRARLAESDWRRTVTELPLLQGLDQDELQRLRELVVLFLHDKSFISKGNLEIDESMRLLIATQACLPILNLDLDYYRGWSTIILYPQSFVAEREHHDQAGVVHTYHSVMVGEAWDRGPLVLSWQDVLCSGDGFNVVIHEFAHKLDMLNGEVNGFPPLHADMDAALWSRVFSRAYENFCQQVESGMEAALDPYAAESPGEFFAVLSEAFFETPAALNRSYPLVYRQLRAFYRQDPLARLALRPASSLTSPL